jgi:hypothetical protein
MSVRFARRHGFHDRIRRFSDYAIEGEIALPGTGKRGKLRVGGAALQYVGLRAARHRSRRIVPVLRRSDDPIVAFLPDRLLPLRGP